MCFHYQCKPFSSCSMYPILEGNFSTIFSGKRLVHLDCKILTQGIKTWLPHAKSSREGSAYWLVGLEDGAETWRNVEQAAKTLLVTICRKLSLLKWSKTWNQCFNVLIIEFGVLPTVFQLDLSLSGKLKKLFFTCMLANCQDLKSWGLVFFSCIIIL
ncbi:hypothetical protein RHMOL_Rhmol05G0201700 [Rhododendron molle]|uniref:Uncharacterized protein n=1 Tax=Rhododendron molle TaxID=49168 RepID=A0ACC0NS32_RHOML|nr:hypothetical protein RHMOL_Rhmol05G0201700 [Rhododendron molle]